ncbi:MAG: hypothetical protein U0531_02435 [Dehalococcoidia bacterium]
MRVLKNNTVAQMEQSLLAMQHSRPASPTRSSRRCARRRTPSGQLLGGERHGGSGAG